MKKKVFLILTLLFSFFIILIFLECIFRFLVHTSDSPFCEFDKKYAVLKYEPNVSGYHSIGRFCSNNAFWRINNMGWNSIVDYDTLETGNKIAIIGDSYIEAFQMDVGKNISDVVRSKLPRNTIYSFGISGAPMSQYLQMSRYVKQVFHPNVIVFNIVHNDFLESLSAIKREPAFLTYSKHDSSFKEDTVIPSPPAKFTTRLFMKSAFIRYLLLNLNIENLFSSSQLTQKNLKRYDSNVDIDLALSRKEDIMHLFNLIFDKVDVENPHTRILFMVDGLRTEIYSNRPPEKSELAWMNELIRENCISHHFECIDMSNVFNDDFKKNRNHFEFKDDWHWNEYGHMIAGDTLSKLLLTTKNSY